MNDMCASDAKSPILEYFMSLRTLRKNEPEMVWFLLSINKDVANSYLSKLS